MNYTIEKVEFLDPEESCALSLVKDKINNYFIEETDWKFLRLPSFYSKITYLRFLNQIEYCKCISVFPNNKQNAECYLNSESFVGSLIELLEMETFFYKIIPQKIIFNTTLTTYNEKIKNFYSDYNNLGFAIITEENDYKAFNTVQKELFDILSKFFGKDAFKKINKKHLSTGNIFKCRNKNNKFSNLDINFYLLPERDINEQNTRR